MNDTMTSWCLGWQEIWLLILWKGKKTITDNNSITELKGSLEGI